MPWAAGERAGVMGAGAFRPALGDRFCTSDTTRDGMRSQEREGVWREPLKKSPDTSNNY